MSAVIKWGDYQFLSILKVDPVIYLLQGFINSIIFGLFISWSWDEVKWNKVFLLMSLYDWIFKNKTKSNKKAQFQALHQKAPFKHQYRSK